MLFTEDQTFGLRANNVKSITKYLVSARFNLRIMLNGALFLSNSSHKIIY